MSPRLLTALSVSMCLHAVLWAQLFWSPAPVMGRSKPAFTENSIFIDPAAMEAVRNARIEKKRSASARIPEKPKAAPKKKPAPSSQPKAEVKKSDKALSGPPPVAAPSRQKEDAAPASIAPSPERADAPAATKTGQDLLANPKTRGMFADYYSVVRSRIQEKLREKCQGRQVGSGSVELAFVLLLDGQLQKVYVVDRQGQASADLKMLAIQSLRESAPFPSFPKEFSARQIAFNLTVFFDNFQ